MKILYIKPTDLFGITNEVVRRLDLTKCSWIRFFQYNLAYFSSIKISAKAMSFLFSWLSSKCDDILSAKRRF